MGKYQIVWRTKARQLYIKHLSYAYQEFGAKAFYAWVDCIREMEDRLQDYPRAYTKVPELSDMFNEYRGHIVMRNFKVIYTVDEKHRKVKIITIWDMRMNPVKLQRNIK